MSDQVLRTHVHVQKDGQSVILEPGTKVPAWAKDQVTNPKAFASADEVAADAEAQESGESDEQQESGDKPYAERSKAELVDLLKGRELPHSGSHDDLVKRLEQADAEAQESGESDEQQESGEPGSDD